MTAKEQVLQVYPKAVCNYINYMLCYVVYTNANWIIGTGDSHSEAWANALKNIQKEKA